MQLQLGLELQAGSEALEVVKAKVGEGVGRPMGVGRQWEATTGVGTMWFFAGPRVG